MELGLMCVVCPTTVLTQCCTHAFHALKISRLQHDAANYMQFQYNIPCATRMLRMKKHVLPCCIGQDDVNRRTDLVKFAVPIMEYLLHLGKY